MSQYPARDAHPSCTVSIICRTVGRPTLEETIRSVQAQTHGAIELILVDAAEKTSQLPDLTTSGIEARIISPGRPLSRPEAANAGLDAARGDYLLFLDDDDWIADDHIEQLLQILEADDNIGVAYASVMRTTASGTPTDECFRRSYSPDALRHDNYIPIHAALIRRSLTGADLRFDESLAIFEDWDFWLQLSRRTQFRHLDVCTAFYRSGGNSLTGSDDPGHRYQAGHPIAVGREKLFDKWLPRWTGREYNRTLDDLDQEQQLKAQLESAGRERSRILEELEQVRGALEALRVSQEETRRTLDTRNGELGDARDRVGQLESEIARIHQSLSWKLTGPFRHLKQRLRPVTSRRETHERSTTTHSKPFDE